MAPQVSAPPSPLSTHLSPPKPSGPAEHGVTEHLLAEIPREKIPRHIAIIMDGNGRWAKQRGLPRVMGHRSGAKSVRAILEECVRLGIEVLTLYSFSIENWKRPPEEISSLMQLYMQYLDSEENEFHAQKIRFRQIGQREGLSPELIEAARKLEDSTSQYTGTTLCLAVNYGSRTEIVDAVRQIARRVKSGELDPNDITEQTLQDNLYTADMPDPDLLIRTAGEMRLSNYLLWQISYAELHVTNVLWPDFGIPELHQAIRSYAARTRKFGGLCTKSESE